VDPPGYCHFPTWLDENYVRQLTSEYLASELYRGRQRKVWKIRSSERDNHFLDCRVYCLAIAEYLGLSSLTADEWCNLAKLRGFPDGVWNRDAKPAGALSLAGPMPVPVAEDPPQTDVFARFARMNEGTSIVRSQF
jgi:phage terminase large subunit GpA-like protein